MTSTHGCTVRALRIPARNGFEEVDVSFIHGSLSLLSTDHAHASCQPHAVTHLAPKGDPAPQSAMSGVFYWPLGSCRWPPSSPDSNLTAWPPNWLRSAAITFAENESSCRETKRWSSESVMTGAGTSSSMAACTVQRP